MNRILKAASARFAMFAALAVVVLVSAAWVRPADHHDHHTIVDIASNDERFSTLVTALQAADLVETLQSDGPFTVFAPTNDAFAALPEGTLETLLKPENKEMLQGILLYHVAEGSVMASQVVELDEVMTVYGETVDVEVEDGTVMIGDATVVITDIEASNGVIHVIDSVLLPPTDEM